MLRLFFLIALLLPAPLLADIGSRDAEHRYVKELFIDIQLRSFAENREICGYIGYDRDGRLQTSAINIGTEDSCRLPNFPSKLRVVASFHTHSTYSPRYRSEYPTVQDMDSDSYWDVNGYIATPGGRLWYHDRHDSTVTQLCELECVPQDPNFQVEPGDPIRRVYTRRQLEKIEGF